MPVVVTAAVEGLVDEEVARRLVRSGGGEVGDVHGRRGRSHLLSRLGGYNAAARFAPWLVLVDLDRNPCAPQLVAEQLPFPSRLMSLRVAVRTVETWLMADPQRLAEFLSVRLALIPLDPHSLDRPKEVMVNLARQSRSGTIIKEMVPTRGHSTGSAYTSRLAGFVADEVHGWRPDVAAGNSPEVAQALGRVQELIARADPDFEM